MRERHWPPERLWAVVKGLGRTWAQYMAFAVGSAMLFGMYPPVGAIALLLTIGLPILGIVLWGRSVDEQLGWGDREEGPW